ncbi:uncharacterized protein [Coffea arabica]|uniref:Uncharacterized protein isoform X3 n=1 Tax=Coffea arabica TaxID=13443 RepID=A0ABM4U3N5_COFAR
MVRGGGGAKKEKEENAEAEERKRLKKSAFKNNILSETQATASGSNALNPSATVVKHHGKDIMRKSQRSGKNRYLFSFPGLLGPISGGKVGELKDLGTKNPVLYLDFPQGQMKLFGTIVYPKNRYLTLQFSKTGKNVTCEDYFDNMIVFSDAWWIGKKDENPEEVRLEFPKEMDVEQVQNYDFKGGAGGPSDSKRDSIKTAKKVVEQPSPKFELEEDSSDSQNKPKEVLELTPSRKSARTDSSDSQNKPKEVLELTPSRKSARTAGKTFKFAESSSGDDIADGLGETSGDDFVNNGLESSEGDGDNVAKDILLNSLTLLESLAMWYLTLIRKMLKQMLQSQRKENKVQNQLQKLKSLLIVIRVLWFKRPYHPYSRKQGKRLCIQMRMRR